MVDRDKRITRERERKEQTGRQTKAKCISNIFGQTEICNDTCTL